MAMGAYGQGRAQGEGERVLTWWACSRNPHIFPKFHLFTLPPPYIGKLQMPLLVDLGLDLHHKKMKIVL